MKVLNPAAEAQLAARVFALGFLCGAVRNPKRNDTLTNTRTPPARDCRGRFVARPGIARVVVSSAPSSAPPRRPRPTPARDCRGRFVSRTASAPSWYVFSADAYRIPGEALPVALAAPTISTGPASPAVRKRPRKRPWFTRGDLESALLALFIVLVSLFYAAHLPRPQR
jgi:hypothetical protein